MMKSYAPKTWPSCLPAWLPSPLRARLSAAALTFVIRLHSGAVQPDALCYLGHIPELKKIEKQGDIHLGRRLLHHDPDGA